MHLPQILLLGSLLYFTASSQFVVCSNLVQEATQALQRGLFELAVGQVQPCLEGCSANSQEDDQLDAPDEAAGLLFECYASVVKRAAGLEGAQLRDFPSLHRHLQGVAEARHVDTALPPMLSPTFIRTCLHIGAMINTLSIAYEFARAVSDLDMALATGSLIALIIPSPAMHGEHAQFLRMAGNMTESLDRVMLATSMSRRAHFRPNLCPN